MDTNKEGFLRSPRVIMKSHLSAAICLRPGFGPRLSDSKTLDLSRAIYCLQFLSLLTHQILCTGPWTSLRRRPTASRPSCCWHFMELSGPTFSAHKGPRLLDFPLQMSTLYSFVFPQCHFSLPASGCSKPSSVTYYLYNFILQSFTFLSMKGRWYHL